MLILSNGHMIRWRPSYCKQQWIIKLESLSDMLWCYLLWQIIERSYYFSFRWQKIIRNLALSWFKCNWASAIVKKLYPHEIWKWVVNSCVWKAVGLMWGIVLSSVYILIGKSSFIHTKNWNNNITWYWIDLNLLYRQKHIWI